MLRGEAVRKVWHYVQDKNLRDKADRSVVHCDETLKPIFGGKAKISMFEITGLVREPLSEDRQGSTLRWPSDPRANSFHALEARLLHLYSLSSFL